MAGFDYRAANDESRTRLRTVLGALAPDDYGRSVGGGWTIASVVGHMGFWDRWQAARWRDMLAGRRLGPAVDIVPAEDLANVALEPLWGVVDAAAVGRIALDAADELDATIASAPPEIVAALEDTPNDYLLRRDRHRNEHLDQIDRALGR